MKRVGHSRSGPYALRTGGRIEPLGLPATAPRLSWAVAPDVDGAFTVVTADGWRAASARPWLTYDGPPLTSRSRHTWHVEARDRDGRAVASEPATFEVGLAARADWSAGWIAAPALPFRRESFDPCPYLRHEFDLPAGAGPGRVYASALGLYRLWLNGVELTADTLYRPGWTDFHTRVHHQTYDCTALLRPGRNTLAAVLANGWYAGRLGLLREPGYYGDRPAFLAQVEVDGAPVAVTDATWRAGYGALRSSDLLRGETQDLRREPAGWRDAGFDDSAWDVAEPLDTWPPVEPQPHESIGAYRVHPGTLVHEHARGPAIYDFGQNLVGWTRLTTRCLPSVELIVRHGEILTPDKLVWRDNLRGAFQEDRYAVPDEGPHRLEPSFTMHGFRYAEVWGLPSVEPYGFLRVPPDTAIEAVSVTGLPDAVGRFECSDDRLTRLARAIEWTVRDNFLEVATDCPQRDERHGWLGDAGVIAPTAAYHFDISAFLTKFAQDAADAQGPDGEIRNYVPAVPPATLRPGAPGWSDGYIRLVHLLAQRYGDLPTARRLFDSMLRFLDHVDRTNPDGLRVNAVGADFGDWLSLPDREGQVPHDEYSYTGAFSTTPKAVHGTAHSYRSFVQLSEIAAWLGRDEESARLARRAERIRDAYRAAFVLPDGSIKDATQTAYAQAVGFGLLDGPDARVAADRLREAIERTGHVTTGIHGVQHVLPVLHAHGHADFAVDQLLRDAMPSWLYMVGQGATTVWEKWDGIRPDGTLATAEMNSFNHCALGAVGRFLFESVGGIDATHTAWTGEVAVRPAYSRRLDWVRASYDSPVGTIASAWRWVDDVVVHELEIPGTAHALVSAPAGSELDCDGRTGAELRLGPGRHTVTVRGAGAR